MDGAVTAVERPSGVSRVIIPLEVARYEPRMTAIASAIATENKDALAVHKFARYCCMKGLWRYSETSQIPRMRFTASCPEVRAKFRETWNPMRLLMGDPENKRASVWLTASHSVYPFQYRRHRSELTVCFEVCAQEGDCDFLDHDFVRAFVDTANPGVDQVARGTSFKAVPT